MGNLDYYKPVMAMLGLQFTYAGLALLTRTALLEGMTPRVFVVYRQAIAALLIAPVTYFNRWVLISCFISLLLVSFLFFSFFFRSIHVGHTSIV